MFEAMTYDVLIQRMLDRIPDDMDKREGSVIWDALSPAALELEFLYMCLDYTLNQSFADTQEREYLIRRCAERGIIPYDASGAVLKGIFTPATIDVTNQRFSLNKLNYVVVERIEGEEGAWRVECETPGTAGNQNFGTLIPIDYIDGLETATLTELLIPGEEEEDTEDLRTRYFAAFQNKGYGGNVQDYLDKTNSIEGVGATRVTAVWNGAGTVKLTILDGEFNRASSTLIEKVQNEIDPYQDGKGLGVAPIGHVVTVDTAEEQSVNISTIIEFDVGYGWANTQAAIEENISAYLLELRQSWGKIENMNNPTVVRISQIETRLLTVKGIVDVTGTKINGTAANLSISGNKIPVIGAVTNGA